MSAEPSNTDQESLAVRHRNQKQNGWLRYCVGVASVFGLFMLLTLWALGPEPPRELIIATGPKVGFYHQIGKQYKEILEEKGISVRLVPTSGSLDKTTNG